MNPSATPGLDDLGVTVLQRYSTLSRVVYARARTGFSRTEVGVLRALTTGPRRVTELAAGESISQPAATKVVNGLERRGLVKRESDPADARAALVRLTDAGREALEGVRADFRGVLHDGLAELDSAEIETLASAAEILERVIARVGDAS